MGFPMRSVCQSVLIGSLLVLGHVLLTTSATSPIPNIDINLSKSISHLSSLIFFNLLYQSFSLLEKVDVLSHPCVKIDGVSYEAWRFFGNPVVGGLIQSLLCGYAYLTLDDGLLVVDKLSVISRSEHLFLQGSYITFLLSLTLLHLHTLFTGIKYLFQKTYQNFISSSGSILLIEDGEERAEGTEQGGRGWWYVPTRGGVAIHDEEGGVGLGVGIEGGAVREGEDEKVPDIIVHLV